MPGILPVPVLVKKSNDILPVSVLIRDNDQQHLAILALRQTRAQAKANGLQTYTHLPSRANRRIVTCKAEFALNISENENFNLTAEQRNDGTAEWRNGGIGEWWNDGTAKWRDR